MREKVDPDVENELRLFRMNVIALRARFLQDFDALLTRVENLLPEDEEPLGNDVDWKEVVKNW